MVKFAVDSVFKIWYIYVTGGSHTTHTVDSIDWVSVSRTCGKISARVSMIVETLFCYIEKDPSLLTGLFLNNGDIIL